MSDGKTSWPLGGDVSQWINPTWWLGSFGQQLGFINVTQVRSGDPQLERRIVEEVASYGRQLGWVTEALDAVIACLHDADLTDKLTSQQLGALDRLRTLVENIKRIKTPAAAPGRGHEDTLEVRIARLEDELRRLNRRPEHPPPL
jgi:hypothetical protein